MFEVEGWKPHRGFLKWEKEEGNNEEHNSVVARRQLPAAEVKRRKETLLPAAGVKVC